MEPEEEQKGEGPDSGELLKYVRTLQNESEDEIKNLAQTLEQLDKLKRHIEFEKSIDRQYIVGVVKEIIAKIESLKKKEEQDIKEEIIANNLLNKLKNWVDEIV